MCAAALIGTSPTVRGSSEISICRAYTSEESAFVDPDNLVRPIEALRQGKVDAVVAAAHSFLEAFS